MLRRENPHTAMLLSIAAGVLIFLSVLKNITGALNGVGGLLSGVDTDGLSILFKVMGICYLTEFTCDCVTEAGLLNLSFAGKAVALLTALPLFNRILGVIQNLGGTAG